MTPEIMIVAAEASSALYAQRLLEHWQKNNFKVQAFGIGSNEMEVLGFQRIAKSEDMAIMGFVEVVKHYQRVKKVFHQLIYEVEKRRPKVVLLMDYPEFNLRLAKEIKKLNIPVVYYISPQIWAWRQYRVKTIKENIDRMLVLLPFEKEFYARHGVDVEFVGHPILDEIDPQLFDLKERTFQRQRYGVGAEDLLVGIMPGSRHSELERHLNTQLLAADHMWQQAPHLKFALLVAPSFTLEQVKARIPTLNFPLTLIRDDPMKMVSLTDMVMVASGTATLIVGVLKKPMVIMYKMNNLTAWLAKRIVKGVSHFGLINLILGRSVVPELLQNAASAEGISMAMMKYVNDSNFRQKIENELSQAQTCLGEKGATARVAKIIENYFTQKPTCDY